MAVTRTQPLPCRPHGAELDEELRAFRGASMAEHARVLEALCRQAAEATAQHPDPQKVLDWKDPLPEESEALLARLRQRGSGRA